MKEIFNTNIQLVSQKKNIQIQDSFVRLNYY